VDILLTLAEVAALVITFSVLNWLIGIGTNVVATKFLPSKATQLATLRQNSSLVLLVICIGLCLLVVAVNGALIYQGKNVLSYQLRLLQSIPTTVWTGLATAVTKCVLLLLLIKFSIPYLHQLLDWASDFAKNYDRIKANDDSIAAFFTALKKALTNSAWLFAVLLCAQFLQLPVLVSKYLWVILKAYLAISVGRLFVKVISALVDTLDALSVQFSSLDNVLRYYERFRHLIPALKKCLEYVLYVGIATLVVQDIEFIAWAVAYADEIVQIIAIYFLSGVVIEFGNIILEDLVLQIENLSDLQRQRRLTIIPLFKSFLKYTVYFTAALAVLKLIQIDPTPILAGAGILGLAIGFGAQNLINDIVSGFFILFENYYLVGDYIETGRIEERTVEGVVEAIELRTTHIRHPDGQLQIIRNGEVGSVVNYSKQYIYAKVEVPLPHRIDLDRVYQIIENVGQQLKAESLDVLEPTYVDGLENFGEENLVLRTLTKVKPGKHLHIQRLLRGRLKLAFDQQEIALVQTIEN
jgi:moderate conductance mechanosensitive channel